MPNIILELEPQTKASLSRAWMIPVGIANLAQGFLMQSEWRYFNIGFGILLIAGGFYYWKLYKPKIVIFDEIGVEGKIKSGTILELKWEELSRLEATIYEIILHTKTGQKYVIDLSNLTFQQHKEIKPKIFELAKLKQIEVVAA